MSRGWAPVIAAVSAVLTACGPGQLLGPTTTPSPTSTFTPTWTPVPTPTSTASPTPTSTPIPTGIHLTPGPHDTTVVADYDTGYMITLGPEWAAIVFENGLPQGSYEDPHQYGVSMQQLADTALGVPSKGSVVVAYTRDRMYDFPGAPAVVLVGVYTDTLEAYANMEEVLEIEKQALQSNSHAKIIKNTTGLDVSDSNALIGMIDAVLPEEGQQVEARLLDMLFQHRGRLVALTMLVPTEFGDDLRSSFTTMTNTLKLLES